MADADRSQLVVLLDESGQQAKALPVQVGAAVCTDPSGIEAALRNLYDELAESVELEGTGSFEAFLKQGFHNWQIPFEIQIRFVQELRRLGRFRVFIALSHRTRLPNLDDDKRCAVLYAALLPDLLLYLRGTPSVLIFETNETLNGRFQLIVDDAVQRAADKAGKEVPAPRVEIAGKFDAMALAVVDFALAIVGRWISDGMPDDPKNLNFRNYKAIERNIAMIYDFDSNTRSTRQDRAFV